MIFCSNGVADAEVGMPMYINQKSVRFDGTVDNERGGSRKATLSAANGNADNSELGEGRLMPNLEKPPTASQKFKVKNTFVDVDEDGPRFLDRRKIKSAPVGADLCFDSSDSDTDSDEEANNLRCSVKDGDHAAAVRIDTTMDEIAADDSNPVESEPLVTSHKARRESAHSVTFKALDFTVKKTVVDAEIDPSYWSVARRIFESASADSADTELASDSSESEAENDKGNSTQPSSLNDGEQVIATDRTDTKAYEISSDEGKPVENAVPVPPNTAWNDKIRSVAFNAIDFTVKNTFVDVEVNPDNWFVAQRKLRSAPAAADFTCDSSESESEGDDEMRASRFTSDDANLVVATPTVYDCVDIDATRAIPNNFKLELSQALEFNAPNYVDVEEGQHRAAPLEADSVQNTPRSPYVKKQLASHKLKGSVWNLSRCSSGSRALQEAFEFATSEERNDLAFELKDHIWDAAHDLHANYVVQKMIMLMHPRALQFVIDELSYSQGAACLASQNKYACRVLQRLLEYCSPAQVDEIVKDLLSNTLACCCDKYSKYVMQNLLEHGTMSQVRQLMSCLAQNAHRLATHENGRCVIGKSMSTGLLEDRIHIAQEIYSVPGLVQSMSSAEGRFVARAVQAVMSRASSTSVESRKQGNTSGATTCAVESGAGGKSTNPSQAQFRGQKKKNGKGGGEYAQKEAEARDLLESLRAACTRRSPAKISKAVDRIQNVFSTHWASPALHIEALQSCEHARQLMQALSGGISNLHISA